ncbi:MAG: cytochrome d ubiquinol oxidase subunit II [Candidatus Lernaella stagnicola]|nr:cytochrome d ubiquinol oxidase subunit II [Candidatus Lernaella stagnicola]
MMTLQVLWYFLVGILLTGYAVLDGFDLGTGYWYLRDSKDRHRTIMLNAIGPVWDGNEVWLITGGGALFAAFPMVYASVFSGMYLALILVLFGLILRATSIEFRGQLENPKWRRVWDLAFGVGSLLPALLFGVALGNVIVGMDLNDHGDYVGGFLGLLNPYSLFAGVYTVVAFVVHGALFLLMKTEDELAEKIKAHLPIWWKAYLALFLLVGPMTAIFALHMFRNFMKFPIFFFMPAAILAGIVLISVYVKKEEFGKAFLASAVAIASIMLTVGVMAFPTLVHATDAANHLTAFNSSSGKLTLAVMLGIALFGMPIVLVYNIWIYRTFAGKVKPEDLAY